MSEKKDKKLCRFYSKKHDACMNHLLSRITNDGRIVLNRAYDCCGDYCTKYELDNGVKYNERTN